ncbi:Inositolphosphorylceramide synthase subunit Kei1-domain-containing protein [Amylocystis lapponica]|nr:Inositolphosphorylceramide synthase subunit Kei1-domain-containing protein [Amylocystis lapponica]
MIDPFRMKLTLRPEWRLRPLSSFLGCLDLKTGVTIVVLFALLNKVAGVYGLVALLTGAGGSAAQLSLYIYSVIGLTALMWGLKAIAQEDPKHSLYFAHIFFADHVLSTAYLVFFAVVWWVYTPHDGRRQANSAAQKEMMEAGPVGAVHNMTDAERFDAAMSIWHAEKGRATAVIVIGWLAKIYFAALIYSYAIHLRKGSYRSLPHSRPAANGTLPAPLSALPDEEDDVVEDFYRLPVRTPVSASHSAHPSLSQSAGTAPPGSSITSFTDFVAAPPPGRRTRPGRSNLSVSHSATLAKSEPDEVDEVLFDEDEFATGSGSTGREGSTSGDSHDDERPLAGGLSVSGSRNHSRRQSRSRA